MKCVSGFGLLSGHPSRLKNWWRVYQLSSMKTTSSNRFSAKRRSCKDEARLK